VCASDFCAGSRLCTLPVISVSPAHFSSPFSNAKKASVIAHLKHNEKIFRTPNLLGEKQRAGNECLVESIGIDFFW
jgi:hypothetical protein